ncbi:MAG: hypothetical protein Ta2B_06240 [Termitinemataceae bacterium]|nr:MAG: hypothetical protein Ta2B_06240 [Termitinemataceae bacterium]
MAKEFPIRNYKQGVKIITENVTAPDCFFVVKTGHVRISTTSGVPLFYNKDIVGAGEFFGVAACLNESIALDTAIAESDVTVTCVSKADFPSFIGENLGTMNRIQSYLSGRLRLLNDYLTRGVTKTDSENSLNMIFTNGEYFYKQKLFTRAFCAYKKYLKFAPDGEFAKQAAEKANELAEYGKNIRFDYGDKDLKRFYPVNTLIFSEKELGTEMFVVQKGKINITKIVDNKEIILATLKQGDVLGEMGLIDQKPRSANAVATEDCEIMAIAKAVYLPLLKDANAIIERICKTLAQRICTMHERIKNELQKSS